jgi:Ca2+-binding RTX toxin-like protein
VIHVSEPPERALTTALAVDSAGNVTVAWVNQVNDSSVLQVRRISATDKLGPLQTLTKTSEGRIVGVAAAVGPNRQPLVVYNQFGRIKAQRLSPSGKPLPGIMHISGADDTAAYLSAAADAAGVVRVSWGRLDPDPLQTFTRTVAADGTLGTTQTVSATRSAAASLAVNSAGDASIAWQDTPKDDPVSVQASTILPSGKPGPAFRLSPFSQAGGFDPEVGMDDQGTSMAVWQRDLGGTVVVEAARFTNAGLLGNVKALSRPSDLVPSPDVAVNPDGNALAVWWQGTPDSSQVRAKAALFLPPLNNPPTSTPPNPRCHGKLADIVGTRQGDPIVGTRGKDVIVGRGGNDKIRGRAGKDVICGDAGNDFLRGGRGHDRVFGGRGKDDVRP